MRAVLRITISCWKATEKAIEILETHIPEPLLDDIRKEVHLIVEKAEAELGISN